jgi:ribose 5-phosphate isomerase B
MTHFVDHFLATAFTGEERHVRRIAMLADYEQTGDLPPLPESARQGEAPVDPEEGRA